jgi:hypothetical protein
MVRKKEKKNGKKKKKRKDDELAPGCACGSGLLVVILTPLERGDRGASNGVKIIEIGVLSTELWMVINQSQKRFSFKNTKCDSVSCVSVWQWLGGSGVWYRWKEQIRAVILVPNTPGFV